MAKYIVVREEVVESFWKVEANTHNDAMDKLDLIRKKKKEDESADMVKEYVKWQAYQWVDMNPKVNRAI